MTRLHRLLVVLGIGLSMAHGGSRLLADEWNRALVSEIMVLEPGPDGFQVRGPLDVSIVEGKIAAIGPGGSLKARPGEIKVRGRDRWLAPCPRVALTRAPTSEELVVAGISGIGAVAFGKDDVRLADMMRRARLDTSALPLLLRDPEIPGMLSVTTSRIPPGLDGLAAGLGGAAVLVEKLAQNGPSPVEVGDRAGFLVLNRDPRLEPESYLDPHAVFIGPEVILRSQRLVRLEEAAAFRKLAPLPPPKPGPGDVWSRRYELVIDGLLRGEAWLEIASEPSGRREAVVRSQTAHPLDERLRASVEWPSGRASLSMTSHGRPIRATSTPDREHGRSRLEVEFRGESLDSGPLVLESGQRFLPHTLLVLADTLAASESDGPDMTEEVVEIELLTDRPGISMTPRPVFRPIAPEEVPEPFTPALADQFMRNGGNSILCLEGDVPGELAAILVTDSDDRLLRCLMSTPWGLTEWRLATSTPLRTNPTEAIEPGPGGG